MRTQTIRCIKSNPCGQNAVNSHSEIQIITIKLHWYYLIINNSFFFFFFATLKLLLYFR